MANDKKYLKVTDENDAKRKAIDAYLTRHPNLFSDQMALHLQNPSKYPPEPKSKYICGWNKNPATGECELEIEIDDAQFFHQDDQGKMTDASQLEDQQ